MSASDPFGTRESELGINRIVGALANLGHRISDQAIGNILRRPNIAPAPERSRTTTWKEFVRSHMGVLAGRLLHCGSAHLAGLVTYYVLFFVQVSTRQVWVGGITRHPDWSWMAEVARNILGQVRLIMCDKRHTYLRSVARWRVIRVASDAGRQSRFKVYPTTVRQDSLRQPARDA